MRYISLAIISLLLILIFYPEQHALKSNSINLRQSLIGSYNTSPESYDGEKLLYLEQVLEKRYNLIIKDIATENKIIIDEVFLNDIHNGINQMWIDEKLIAYEKYPDVFFYRIDTKEYRKIENSKLGLTASGESEVVINSISRKEFYKYDFYKEELVKAFDENVVRESIGSSTYKIFNPKISNDGLKVAFRLDVSEDDKMKSKTAIFNFENKKLTVFKSHILHFNWAGGYISGVGHLGPKRFYSRWNLNGIEVKKFRKYLDINHFSETTRYIAYDNYYGSETVNLEIYDKKENETYKIFSHKFDDLTWRKKLHVNPSFNLIGNKLYFNRAIGNESFEIEYVDLKRQAVN